MVDDLERVVNVLNLWRLVNHSKHESKQSFREDFLDAKGGQIHADGRTVAEDGKKGEALGHCFIVVSAQKASENATDFRCCNLFCILKTEDLKEPKTEVSKAVRVHDEINDCVEEFLAENQSQSVLQLLHAIEFEQEQVHFVDQSCHVRVIFKGPSFQFASCQDQLAIKLEHLVEAR